MESSNAIQLVTSHVTGDNKSKAKKVKTDKVYKQKSLVKGLTEKEQAEKVYGMKFKEK